ncbi:LacI family DNA-binding transcriptional regulator [Salipaludibacillus aurantiacus]|uniref:LacI family transcriptional regulator, repressor for deo operon, udp, cdd, tsx, nupC, and nupG n=1 Tax=Salipaludibacillus aurantiacus TaxID=1601833 RepID=A0A1H9SEV4_9BACI|nr:LacI family DNA-binding transcriptional regulator [Salipaludibacillus aurantiacus]SER83497.1 LacI family transcriptional regulator, repressor for deo operon, udp, cdd, tsx, nupC, and nupG [Salipaludibacillus aurantiacus]
MKRITIKDVAREANTSQRTVSRVLNKDPKVKKETREKVQRIIEELGFEVHMPARLLKEKKTKQIVVFIDRHEGLYWGSFHNEILQELHKAARKEGYRMVISSSSGDSFEEDENDGFYLVKNGLCDGAIMFDSKPGDKRIEYLSRREVPFVLIGKDRERYDTPFVDLDNEYAGYLGARYLHSKGHEKMTFFLGNEGFVVNKERAAGFNRYCEEHKLEGTCHYDVASMGKAYEETLRLLEDSPKQCIFMSGDERALGVYRAVREKGLRIPEDVAVLGIDNIKMGEFLWPAITTIDQPKEDMGSESFKILLEQLNGRSSNMKRIMISPRIIERESV